MSFSLGLGIIDFIDVYDILHFLDIIFEDVGGVGLGAIRNCLRESSLFVESFTPGTNFDSIWVSPAGSWDPYIN